MKLIGHGIDIVSVSRIRALLSDSEFEPAWFTANEQKIAQDRPDRAKFYAGRIAAKEAVVKALGTGFTETITPMDLEIRSSVSGVPTVVLSGAALDTANQLGINRWALSISKTDEQAIASAIALHEEGQFEPTD